MSESNEEVGPDLHEQAQAALYDRVRRAHAAIVDPSSIRLSEIDKNLTPENRAARRETFSERAQHLFNKMVEDAQKVYEDAIQRRGPHQAALDQLQGAVGLPVDPAAHQAEVERREALHAEARAVNTPVPVVPVHPAAALLDLDGDGIPDELEPDIQPYTGGVETAKPPLNGPGHYQPAPSVSAAETAKNRVGPNPYMPQGPTTDPAEIKRRQELATRA